MDIKAIKMNDLGIQIINPKILLDPGKTKR